MAPHIETMRQLIAEDLRVELDQVNVKATTTEKLGFTGREDGTASGAFGRPACCRHDRTGTAGPARIGGEPLGTAVLKAVAEDFQVDEVLGIPLSGQGEHLWLWVEKRDLATPKRLPAAWRAPQACR